MTIKKESYKMMNKAYNIIFDEWQNVEDIDPEVNKKINFALVLLDEALDELKKVRVESEDQINSNENNTGINLESLKSGISESDSSAKSDSDDNKPTDTTGFTIIGGKK